MFHEVYEALQYCRHISDFTIVHNVEYVDPSIYIKNYSRYSMFLIMFFDTFLRNIFHKMISKNMFTNGNGALRMYTRDNREFYQNNIFALNDNFDD